MLFDNADWVVFVALVEPFWLEFVGEFAFVLFIDVVWLVDVAELVWVEFDVWFDWIVAFSVVWFEEQV